MPSIVRINATRAGDLHQTDLVARSPYNYGPNDPYKHNRYLDTGWVTGLAVLGIMNVTSKGAQEDEERFHHPLDFVPDEHKRDLRLAIWEAWERDEDEEEDLSDHEVPVEVYVTKEGEELTIGFELEATSIPNIYTLWGEDEEGDEVVVSESSYELQRGGGIPDKRTSEEKEIFQATQTLRSLGETDCPLPTASLPASQEQAVDIADVFKMSSAYVGFGNNTQE